MFRFCPTPASTQLAPTRVKALCPGLGEARVLMPTTGPLRLGGQTLAIELPPGRALTLHIQRDGLLRLRGMRVWLTFTSRGKAEPGANDGEAWTVASGQAWVAEPFDKGEALAAASHLDWQPAPGWNQPWEALWDRMVKRRSRPLPSQAAWG